MPKRQKQHPGTKDDDNVSRESVPGEEGRDTARVCDLATSQTLPPPPPQPPPLYFSPLDDGRRETLRR
uniref:Uncharacterized protein n=1 Tax=Vespula pensylvanica TaxID=30213 RepID=A0A834PFH8_VESPE|nr:hypothetical protein H0235_001108 [Vespula pensylvanica]